MIGQCVPNHKILHLPCVSLVGQQRNKQSEIPPYNTFASKRPSYYTHHAGVLLTGTDLRFAAWTRLTSPLGTGAFVHGCIVRTFPISNFVLLVGLGAESLGSGVYGCELGKWFCMGV